MAYNGTTAASSVSNPPILLARGMGQIENASGWVIGSTSTASLAFAGGTGLWYYASVDGTTVTQGTAYFTDGLKLGMRNGDFILVACATAAASTSSIGIGLGMLMTTNSTAGFNVAVSGLIANS